MQTISHAISSLFWFPKAGTTLENVVPSGLERRVNKNYFVHFSTKTYVVGTQKKHLSEMVVLSTRNKCLKLWIRKYSQFYAESICLYRFMSAANF